MIEMSLVVETDAPVSDYCYVRCAAPASSTAPTPRILDRDHGLAPDVVDWPVLIVVVVIGVISVVTMIVPVIGHRISDSCAANPTHDRTGRTANNSPGNRTPTPPVIAPLSSAKDPRAKRSHRIICAVRKALAVAAWSRGVRGGDVAAPFCVHHLECSRQSRLLVSVLGMFVPTSKPSIRPLRFEASVWALAIASCSRVTGAASRRRRYRRRG
jgi:hypothetical protein